MINNQKKLATIPDKLMTAEDVISLYKMLEQNGINTVIDGGWGIDALLGEETRPHIDLDLAVEHKNIPRLRELLAERGFNEIDRYESSDFAFVLADDMGHEVDVHSYIFDDKGNNIYGIAYPFKSLKGKGTIKGYKVRCIAVEYVMQFHGNYEPGEKEIKDIKALQKKFGIEPPPNYKNLI